MHTYIVTFRPETTDSEMAKARADIIAKGGNIVHEYSLIKGFSANIPDGPVIQALATLPHIESVEKDSVVTTQ